MTKVNNIFIKKVYFILVAVLSLFSYSNEPLNSFDGKMLMCKPDRVTDIYDPYTTDNQKLRDIPTNYIGFKFIENTVYVDRIVGNPPEIKRSIEDIYLVKEFEAEWCDGKEIVMNERKPTIFREGCKHKFVLTRSSGKLTQIHGAELLGMTKYYSCKVEQHVHAYGNYLANLKRKEENRLKDIETEKLKKLKERKL
tara:strand:- start:343 stop:930 length:588 start_codon:yes stop_codon:yes gene_type:complete